MHIYKYYSKSVKYYH